MLEESRRKSLSSWEKIYNNSNILRRYSDTKDWSLNSSLLGPVRIGLFASSASSTFVWSAFIASSCANKTSLSSLLFPTESKNISSKRLLISFSSERVAKPSASLKSLWNVSR